MTHHPKVIFLDAVGTLFGVRGSVGQVYADLADEFGITVSAKMANDAFFRSFQSAPPMAFPDAEVQDISQLEFNWWKAIAQQTFQRLRVLQRFENFDAFFAALYQHFATAEPWFVYSDILPSLQKWQQGGIPLGIISNFDSRLYPVLETLGLKSYFQSITISTEVGVAKPRAEIFHAALAKHDCAPADAWHIGDSCKEDYEAAKQVGLHGIWLRRAEENRLESPH